MTAEDARRRCDELLRERQVTRRLPAVTAAVVRGGDEVWFGGLGRADASGSAPTADTQFRLGSITKTFTAVALMQLRDAGLVDLDAPLSTYLPDTRHGTATARQLLAHLSGLQREPVGDVWATLELPDREEFLAGLEEAELVLPPHRRWHYSNLAYAVLGEVVARTGGGSYAEVLTSRVLGPLGLTRTTFEAQPPHAVGWFVDPYADRMLPEPDMQCAGISSAAQLWSTTRDLGRWAAFLADPRPEVLAPGTLDEMSHLHAMADLEQWTLGWGLGLMLYRRADRVLVGHGGAMPGYLAGVVVARKERVGAVAFTNNTSRGEMDDLAGALVEAWLQHDAQPPELWAPGEPVPDDVDGLLGRWWSEGSEFVFAWLGGELQARLAEAPATRPPAVFARAGEDTWRVVSGREQGEPLRVVRDQQGGVQRLYWATYAFTRDPRPFQPGG